MENWHVNPFLRIQKKGDISEIILPRENGLTRFVLSAAGHPLFGITSSQELMARLHLLHEQDMENLVEAQILAGQAFDRKAMLRDALDKINDPSRLHITINPTMRCNNACLYCYQEHRRQPSMSALDWTILERHIAGRVDQGIASLHISCMGGEPTLALRRLVRFLQYVSKLCISRQVGFTCSLTSNGRLLALPGVAESLVQHGVRHVQLTLDGPADIHDLIRPGISGRPTYAQTCSAIRKLMELPDRPTLQIRTNYTSKSIEPARLRMHMETIAGLTQCKTGVTIAHERAMDLGGTPCRDILLPAKVFADFLPQIHKAAVDAGLANDISGYLAGNVCYAGRKNHVAVYPRGVVRKCTVRQDEDNDVGRLLPDGRMILNHRFGDWTNNTLDDPKCQKCPAALQCLGNACPAKRLEHGARACHPRFFTDIPV